MLARRAVGRVEQMSQQSPQSGGASYDSAAVMLDAPADKVYAAVLRGVAQRAGHHASRARMPPAMLVQFTNGEQIAGIKVSALGDNLTHMLDLVGAHRHAAERSRAGPEQRAARVQGNERRVLASAAMSRPTAVAAPHEAAGRNCRPR